MKNLKNELERIGKLWNASGEHDETEFAERLFIDDDYLSEFAIDNGIEINDDVISEIEKRCDCQIINDYEIIFN